MENDYAYAGNLILGVTAYNSVINSILLLLCRPKKVD